MFYEQGDEEKRAGLVPMKMMDRQYSQELPDLQVCAFELQTRKNGMRNCFL